MAKGSSELCGFCGTELVPRTIVCRGCGAEKVRGLSTGMRRMIVLATAVASAGLLAASAMSSGDGMVVVASTLAGFVGGSMIGRVIAFVSSLFAGSRWVRVKRESW